MWCVGMIMFRALRKAEYYKVGSILILLLKLCLQVGVDFALKVLVWDVNTIVRLQLWDISGW
jgi:hypothetical protein